MEPSFPSQNLGPDQQALAAAERSSRTEGNAAQRAAAGAGAPPGAAASVAAPAHNSMSFNDWYTCLKVISGARTDLKSADAYRDAYNHGLSPEDALNGGARAGATAAPRAPVAPQNLSDVLRGNDGTLPDALHAQHALGMAGQHDLNDEGPTDEDSNRGMPHGADPAQQEAGPQRAGATAAGNPAIAAQNTGVGSFQAQVAAAQAEAQAAAAGPSGPAGVLATRERAGAAAGLADAHDAGHDAAVQAALTAANAQAAAVRRAAALNPPKRADAPTQPSIRKR